MDHAVYAADIHKGAVAGQGFHHTVVLLSDLHLVPQVLHALTALSLCYAPDRADDALSSAVDLGDAETDRLPQQLRKLGIARQIRLACGHKHTYAVHVDNDAALVLFRHYAFQNSIAVNGFFHFDPGLGGVETAFGKHDRPFHIIDTDNNRFNRVTDLHGVFNLDASVGKLRCRDKAGILGAQIDADLCSGDGNDSTADLFSVIYILQALLQHLIEAGFLIRGFFSRSVRRFLDGNLDRCLSRFLNGLDDGSALFLYRFRSGCFFLDVFHFDLVTHFVCYLLNDPRRRRCTRSKPDNRGAF